MPFQALFLWSQGEPKFPTKTRICNKISYSAYLEHFKQLSHFGVMGNLKSLIEVFFPMGKGFGDLSHGF